MVSFDRLPWDHPLRWRSTNPLIDLIEEELNERANIIEAELRRVHQKLCPKYHWLIAEHSYVCLNCLEPVGIGKGYPDY